MWSDRALVASMAAMIGAMYGMTAHAADESELSLVEGAGRERVQASCAMCHSLDYIDMNSPFLDRAGWEKTVKKMVTVYGAPLTVEEAATIVTYLEQNYGL